MKIQFRVVLSIVVLSLAGCGSTNAPIALESESATTTAKVPEKEVGIELLSIKDVPAQLAARKGKVVVLDMWASW